MCELVYPANRGFGEYVLQHIIEADESNKQGRVTRTYLVFALDGVRSENAAELLIATSTELRLATGDRRLLFLRGSEGELPALDWPYSFGPRPGGRFATELHFFGAGEAAEEIARLAQLVYDSEVGGLGPRPPDPADFDVERCPDETLGLSVQPPQPSAR